MQTELLHQQVDNLRRKVKALFLSLFPLTHEYEIFQFLFVVNV